MLVVTADRRIRLVIADRQPIVLQGLRSVFAAQHDFEIVTSCSHGKGCLEAIRTLAPDVALVSSAFSDVTVSEIIARAKAENLRTRLVFFTESETGDDLAAAVAAGACTAISKYAGPETLLRSLRLVTKGLVAKPGPSPGLQPNGNDLDSAKIEKMLAAMTQREREITRLVSEGLSNKEIARQLNVSHGTVKVHLHNIFQKLEISNRTVLAAIALSQRTAGFGTLALVALAFATMDEAKASDLNDPLLDDDSTAHEDLEHAGRELWTKMAILHHIAGEFRETVATQHGASIKTNHVTNAPRMDEPHATQHAALSSFGRGYGAIGSGTPSLLGSKLLETIRDSQTGNPRSQQPLPPLEFTANPIGSHFGSHGGYGTFSLMAAGVLLSTLNDSSAAAQTLHHGETLIDALTVALHGAAQGGTTGIHDASNADARAFVADEAGGLEAFKLGAADVFSPPSADHTIKGGVGDDTIYGGSGSDAIDGNVTVIGGHGDRLSGGKGDDTFGFSSKGDSNAARFDAIIDLMSGEDRINLAAFGALAFLHMDSTSKTVPPHTLAWIYNPVTNETTVYVNATDGSLDIGDARLLELHLQGDISVAGSEAVNEPDAAAIAAALQGIDPALLTATASDGTLLTGSALDLIETATSESTRAAAAAWTMPADDGWRFQFGRDHRIGSTASIRLLSFDQDPAYATEDRSEAAATAPVHVASIALAHGNAAVQTEQHPAFMMEPLPAHGGATTNAHGKAHATASPELPEVGMQIAAPAVVAANAEPDAGAGNNGNHGNSHDSPSPSAQPSAATELASHGNGNGHGNAEDAPHAAAAKGKPTEPGATSAEDVHGNSHASHAASANAKGAHLTEPGDASVDGGGHGNSQHASQSSSAKPSAAAELAGPGNGNGHGNAEDAPHAAAAKGKPTEPGVISAEDVHGNSHASHAASANAKGAHLAEPGDAPADGGGHGNSQHASQSSSAKPSAAELAGPGNGNGHGNAEPPHAAAAKGKPTEPGASSAEDPHGNSHASHAASANASSAGDLTEPGAPSANGTGHGNSHASQSSSANPSGLAEPIETAVVPNAVGHGNAQHASHPAPANGSAPAEPASGSRGIGPEQAFNFKHQGAPSTSAPEPLDVSPVSPGGSELSAIPEVAPAEQHAASHVDHGSHHALGHSSHDLLP